MVWNQYRRVDAGNLSVEDLDMSIKVENPADSEHNFEVEIYNLTQDSWSGVSQDDYCRIALGWEDGNIENVVHGVVEKKTTELDGNDMIFRLKGTQATDHLTKQRVSKSYEDTLSPSEIATDLSGTAGLTAGTIDDAPGTVDTRFPVSTDKPVRHWFSELVKEAEANSGSAWEWFVDGGRFYFVKKDGTKEDAVKLSYDNTLLSMSRADSQADGADGLSFESLMEPKIRKGAAVKVDTEKFSGNYSVVSYTFESDSTSGDHVVSGKLSPISVEHQTQNQGFLEGLL